MSRVRPAQPSQPLTPRGVLCPYCGRISSNPRRCEGCGGFFDPLSRQATQNAMGPWYLRDPAHPFRPGCSYETVRDLVNRGRIRPDTILRGPTTRQFWNFAARTPTVAHLLGICHNCHAKVSPDDYSCAACGAVFTPETDRQHLGLAPVHLLPGQAAPEIIAAASIEHRPAPRRAGTRRAAVSSTQRHGQAAIEPEGGGSAAGRLLMIVGILVLLGGAAVGAVVLSRVLTTPPTPPPGAGAAPTSTGATGSLPPPPLASGTTGETAATPEAPAPVPAPGTAAPGAGAAEPVVPPISPAPRPPPEPALAPSSPPKPDAVAAALIPALRDGPIDETALGGTVQQQGASADAARIWADLIHRRATQLRLRGLP